MTARKHIFGPVASRRLGLSLGLDLVPAKTCNLDCVYCEAKATTNLTLARQEYVSAADIIAELDKYLGDRPQLDYITFSGAGEPTLNSAIGLIVKHIKSKYPEYKLCLLTNAVTFGDQELLSEIRNVDLCIPSFDASNEEEFLAINQPCKGADFVSFVNNLINYTQNASCRVILEVFIVPGVNDSKESIERFTKYIKQMKLEKVQLNTLDRPGTSDLVKIPNKESIKSFIKAFSTFVPVEVVGAFQYKSASLRETIDLGELDRDIINYVLRRPATLEDLATACRSTAGHLRGRLKLLVSAGLLSVEKGERGTFYATFAEFGE